MVPPDMLTLAAPEQDEEALNGEAPIHVLRVGKIYDLEGGRLVLDITEEMAREIAETTQKLIEAGQTIPISLEHGIESGQRGDKSADRRPYGLAKKVWYDEEKKGVYASKEWSALGLSLVAASQTKGGSALRVSPRIKLTPLHHPSTGEALGNSWIDVVSLTSLPRQNEMAFVPLSREQQQVEPVETNVETVETIPAILPEQSLTKPEETGAKGQKMADDNAIQPEVILGRGTKDASVILSALGLDDGCEAAELARAVEAMKDELGQALVELNRYQDEERQAALALRQREAVELLDKHEVEAKAERNLFLASLMSDDPATVEMARNAIVERGAPNNADKVNQAIEAAKERGAVPADFTLEGDVVEHADVVAEVLSRIPDGAVVRVGEAKGSDSAGHGGDHKVMSKQAAGEELSRLARLHISTGKATGLLEAHQQVQNDYPEVYAAAYAKN